MKRFFGMMPSDEIGKEKCFKDKDGYSITIQAGVHGWSIIYADNSSEFTDTDDTVDNNFSAAYTRAVERLGELCEEESSNASNVVVAVEEYEK